MPNQNAESLSGAVAIGKDIVALLRDGALLVMAVLLIFWPTRVNSILVDAGFEEGSFAGLTWKAKLSETDDALVEAQATIEDLRTQNHKLSEALEGTKNAIANAEVKENITKLQRLNDQLDDSSALVQQMAKAATSANAPLVRRFQERAGTVVTWGVVYGGDPTLGSARHEVEVVARRLGLSNASVYLRQGSYRSVATTTDRLEANRLLERAKKRREDAYVVNMEKWCPDAVEKSGYQECSGKG